MRLAILAITLAIVSCTDCDRPKYSIFPTVRPLMGNVFQRITNVSRDAVNVARNMVSNSIDSTIHARNMIVDRIRSVIEEFRKSMRQGIAKYRIPILDPMSFNHTDFDIKHEMGKFKGSVDDVKIFNLSTFQLDNISSWLLQFVMNVTVPQLDIIGKYDIKGKAGNMFSIFGKGPFGLEIFNVSLGIDTGLIFQGNRFSLSHLNLTMKIKKMICNFENLMGGGDNEILFNSVCSDLGPEAIDILWPEMEPFISARIKKDFDKSLSLMNVDDIMHLIEPYNN